MRDARSSSRWKLAGTVALIATALGGGMIGFRSAGVRSSQSSQQTGKANAADPSQSVSEPDGGVVAQDNRELSRRGFTGWSEDDLARLLPNGITEVEGMGGRGFFRQVKSNGLWYPVFDLSHASKLAGPEQANAGGLGLYDPATIELAQVPLAISSSPPPPGKAGESYQHGFTAVGGSPPYHWSMQTDGDTAGFQLDPVSGRLAGRSEQPVTLSLQVFVRDAAGASASVNALVVIAPKDALSITTTELPPATVGEVYQSALAAEGGVPPYTWSLEDGASVWMCDASSGVISGMASEAGDYPLHFRVTDSQQSAAETTLTLKASDGLEIVTSSPLLPAAPGAPYRLNFEAIGGAMPYRWEIVQGGIPGGWSLAIDGVLSGLASKTESVHRFNLRVEDAEGRAFRKDFELAIRQGLIAVASRDKAGLAWQPAVISRAFGASLAGVSIVRGTGDGSGGIEIYRGTGSNIVDRGLRTGGVYDYTLLALTTDGQAMPYASARIQVLPFSLQNGRTGVRADPYADRVRVYSPLSSSAYGAGGLPGNVTGAPDGRDTFSPAYRPTEVASLNASRGGGGSIVLEFTDNIIESGPGLDFTIFENVFFEGGDPARRFMEPAIVEVALFEGEWFRFPFHVNAPVDGEPDLTHPAYYVQGFAGINATTGEAPTDPTRSGGDSFDLDALQVPDLSWIRFIRITATGDAVLRDPSGNRVHHTSVNGALSGGGSSGFDLDAVSAVNY